MILPVTECKEIEIITTDRLYNILPDTEMQEKM